MTLLAWAAAVAGALGYGVASVLQAAASTRRSGPAVLRHPAYVAGLACDGLAWLVSLVAFRTLPLFVVQSVLAGSVAVTVVLAHVVLRGPLRHRDVGAILLLVAALSGLAVAFSPGAASSAGGLTGAVLLGLLVVGGGLALGYRNGAPMALAVLAGLAFTGVAVCVRVLDLSSGVLALLGQPVAWALVGYAGVGTLAYARSLERGPVGAATATLWSVEAVVSGAVGVLLLGDTVRPGWTAVAVLAVVVALTSCVVLATGPAEQALDASVP